MLVTKGFFLSRTLGLFALILFYSFPYEKVTAQALGTGNLQQTTEVQEKVVESLEALEFKENTMGKMGEQARGMHFQGECGEDPEPEDGSGDTTTNEEEKERGTCSKAARSLKTLSKMQKYSDNAGIVAIGTVGAAHTIMGNKSDTAYKMKKTGSVASISAGLVDVYSGTKARAEIAKNIRKQYNLHCGDGQASNDNGVNCNKLLKLEEGIKEASNDAYFKGAAKIAGGAIGLSIAKKYKPRKDELHSLHPPQRVASYGEYIPKKVNNAGFTTASAKALSGTLSNAKRGAESTGPTGALSAQREGPILPPYGSASDGGSSTGASTQSSATGGGNSGALLESEEDPLTYEEEEDVWPGNLSGGLGFSGSVGSGDGGFSEMLAAISGKDSKGKVKLSETSTTRMPASGDAYGKKANGILQNNNLFLRIKKAIYRMHSRGNISTESVNVDTI